MKRRRHADDDGAGDDGAEPTEEDDVAEAIEAGDRPRYEMVKSKIRALYGHSIKIDLGEPDEPPDFLYVGVGSRDPISC